MPIRRFILILIMLLSRTFLAQQTKEQLSLTTKVFNYGNPAYSAWFWIQTKTSLVFQKVGLMCYLLEPFIRDASKTQKDRIR